MYSILQVNINLLEKLESQASANNFQVITNLGCYISNIVSFMLTIAGIAAFFYLVWGGFNWIMSSSDKNSMEEAKQRITNAIIGLAVVASAWAIFLIMDYFFGLGLTNESQMCSPNSQGTSSFRTPPSTTNNPIYTVPDPHSRNAVPE